MYLGGRIEGCSLGEGTRTGIEGWGMRLVLLVVGSLRDGIEMLVAFISAAATAAAADEVLAAAYTSREAPEDRDYEECSKDEAYDGGPSVTRWISR
jgi:hypothetical protein